MGDIGAKVARVNVDVNTASDDQLLFSSGWPTLKIAHEGRVTVDAASDHTIVTHGLGYAPAFMVYRVSGNTSELTSYGTVFDGSAIGKLGVNSTELKYFASGYGSGDVTFYYRVFAQPLTEDFTADILNTTPDVTSPLGYTTESYGLKISKEGKDVYSTDLRDFVVHSGAASPNVHLVGHGVPFEAAVVNPGVQFRVDHNLGYKPLVLNYIDYGANSTEYPSGWFFMLGGNGGPSYIRSYVSTTQATIEEDYSLIGAGSPTSNCAIIVLKEPFDTVNGYSITVFY